MCNLFETHTPPQNQQLVFRKWWLSEKESPLLGQQPTPFLDMFFYHRPVCQSWIASRQLHRPSLQTLAADPHVWVTAGIAKKHRTYQDVPGMTLVLIVKDQPPKQRTNGFQVYIYILYIHTYMYIMHMEIQLRFVGCLRVCLMKLYWNFGLLQKLNTLLISWAMKWWPMFSL